MRHRLVLAVVDAGQPITVAELARQTGVDHKRVSDLLRPAVTRGHIRRYGRGVYQAGHIPRSTEWAMRQAIPGAFAYT